jgi:hypothetical protein
LIWRIWRNEVAEQREDRNGRVPGLHDGVWQSLFLEARVMEADQQGTGKAELLAQNGNLATQLPQSTSNPLGAKIHMIGIK